MDIDELMQSSDSILQYVNNLLVTQKEKKKDKEDLGKRIEDLGSLIEEKAKLLYTHIHAASIVGSISDENTRVILNKITGVINKALEVLFIEDRRVISIKQIMHKKVYPHFVVELVTGNGSIRTFKQSGTGLAQIISFLFTVCLIDARKGRKILVMDELLNGLHPDAKNIIKDLMLALSNKFQFILAEYDLDVGKQYVLKKVDNYSEVMEYTGKYYEDLAKDKFNRKRDRIA